MVVSKTVLAPLARMTAINANRAVRSLKKENKKPLPFRASLIREICERYRTDRPVDEYFASFFITDDRPLSLSGSSPSPLLPSRSPSAPLQSVLGLRIL